MGKLSPRVEDTTELGASGKFCVYEKGLSETGGRAVPELRINGEDGDQAAPGEAVSRLEKRHDERKINCDANASGRKFPRIGPPFDGKMDISESATQDQNEIADERGSPHRDDPLIGSMTRLYGGYYGAWFVDVPSLDAKEIKRKGPRDHDTLTIYKISCR
jgi:hypothetical protein